MKRKRSILRFMKSIPLGWVMAFWLLTLNAWAEVQPFFPAPVQCETVYAVHHDGNDSQVLAYGLHSSALESLALHQDTNIQGLSFHSDSEVLYAAMGAAQSQLGTIERLVSLIDTEMKY